MESLFSLVFIAVIILFVWFMLKFLRLGRREQITQSVEIVEQKYHYARRNYIMTAAERELFRRLEVICGSRYYIFPQIHLSSLLNHTVYRQDWRAALSAIQRKSVDFVLADKTTLETKYAVELDDSTHDTPERQIRDDKV